MKHYERPLYEDEKLLNDFLNIWSLSNIEKMKLNEYTDVNNPNTFTQWIESQTRLLGSIKGISSFKFGIYKRLNPRKRPKNKVFSNDVYSWIKVYGECDFDEEKVFEQVKQRILSVIYCAQQLDFESINNIDGLYNLFKWKLAFLYSGQNMIPVFNRKVLLRFTKDMGMIHDKKPKYSDLHRYLYDQKPTNISVFNFMRKIFYEATPLEIKDKKKDRIKRRARRGTDQLNTNSFEKKGTLPTTIEPRHKILQEKLKVYLEKIHIGANIQFEPNFIDLKLIIDNQVHYYEVKTAKSAEQCIKQGLGQLLSYSFFDNTLYGTNMYSNQRLIIFGEWRANMNDKKFIDYVNQNLKIDFEYLSLEDFQF